MNRELMTGMVSSQRLVFLLLLWFCAQQVWAAVPIGAHEVSGADTDHSDMVATHQGEGIPAVPSFHDHSAEGGVEESCCPTSCQCAISHCLSAIALQQLRVPVLSPSPDERGLYAFSIPSAPVFPLLRPPIAI
jgi:hypothetical protein